jgi:hypothetical protein
VAGLPAAAYGSEKDASAASAAGVLAVGAWAAAAADGPAVQELPEDLRAAWEERAAIMAADGHLPRAEAERIVGRQPLRLQK